MSSTNIFWEIEAGSVVLVEIVLFSNESFVTNSIEQRRKPDEGCGHLYRFLHVEKQIYSVDKPSFNKTIP